MEKSVAFAKCRDLVFFRNILRIQAVQEFVCAGNTKYGARVLRGSLIVPSAVIFTTKRATWAPISRTLVSIFSPKLNSFRSRRNHLRMSLQSAEQFNVLELSVDLEPKCCFKGCRILLNEDSHIRRSHSSPASKGSGMDTPSMSKELAHSTPREGWRDKGTVISLYQRSQTAPSAVPIR